MANITIQQAYALAMGAWQNPYAGGARDQDVIPFGTTYNTSFSINSAIDAVFPQVGGSRVTNNLKGLLSGSAIDIGTIPRETGIAALNPASQTYTLPSSTTTVISNTAVGFDTRIFSGQLTNGVPTVYMYRVGSGSLDAASAATGGFEQIYHLVGLGIMKKLK